MCVRVRDHVTAVLWVFVRCKPCPDPHETDDLPWFLPAGDSGRTSRTSFNYAFCSGCWCGSGVWEHQSGQDQPYLQIKFLQEPTVLVQLYKGNVSSDFGSITNRTSYYTGGGFPIRLCGQISVIDLGLVWLAE